MNTTVQCKLFCTHKSSPLYASFVEIVDTAGDTKDVSVSRRGQRVLASRMILHWDEITVFIDISHCTFSSFPRIYGYFALQRIARSEGFVILNLI